MLLPTELPSRESRKSSGHEVPRGPHRRKFSRSINFNRVDLAVMAVHIKGDWATTYFAILNRRECAGRSVYDRCEYRSAVGAHYLRLYFKFHKGNLSIKAPGWKRKTGVNHLRRGEPGVRDPRCAPARVSIRTARLQAEPVP